MSLDRPLNQYSDPKYLCSINFIRMLRNIKMIGIFHPTHKNAEHIEALLVSTQTALDECNGWSNQDITKRQFIDYLIDNGVEVFNSLEQFVKFKKSFK